MLESSGVKPLFLCVKIFATVTFLISMRHKPGSLQLNRLCPWICPWPIFPHNSFHSMVICEWTFYFFYRCFFLSFFYWILLTALFERAHSSQNALVSWLRTHQVKISACVNVHAEAFPVHSVGSTQRGFGAPLLKNTVCVYFLYLSTPLPHRRPPPGTVRSKRFKSREEFTVVHLGWATRVQLASTKCQRRRRVLTLWRAVVECVFVLMITYSFVSLSFFHVFWSE